MLFIINKKDHTPTNEKNWQISYITKITLLDHITTCFHFLNPSPNPLHSDIWPIYPRWESTNK